MKMTVHTFIFEPAVPEKAEIMDRMLAASSLKTRIRQFMVEKTGIEPMVSIEDTVRQGIVVGCTQALADEIKDAFRAKIAVVERVESRDDAQPRKPRIPFGKFPR